MSGDEERESAAQKKSFAVEAANDVKRGCVLKRDVRREVNEEFARRWRSLEARSVCSNV